MTTFRGPARHPRPAADRDAALDARSSASPTTSPTRYGYRRIETPLLEQAAVFERGVGEVTDIVEKELFRIAPRTEESESWSLRPEPTAGIVRAYVQHGMQTWPQPVKLADDRADVPLRPTAGGPLPAVLAVRHRGDRRSWPRHRRRDHRARDALLRRCRPDRRRGAPQLDRGPGLPARLRRGAHGVVPRTGPRELPAAELERLDRNVLRLLDSKDPAMVAAQRSRRRGSRTAVRCLRRALRGRPAHLHVLGVPFRLEPGLVRGLDYYTRTAFEFYVSRPGGTAAGARRRRPLRRPGRAAGRASDPGDRLRDRPGPAAPRARRAGRGPGRARSARRRSWSGPIRTTRSARLRIATELRAAGIAARAELGRRKLGKQLEAAARDQAHFAVILGDELAAGDVQVRDLPAGTQKVVPRGGPRPRDRPRPRSASPRDRGRRRRVTEPMPCATTSDATSRSGTPTPTRTRLATRRSWTIHGGLAWGVVQIPEAELQILGDVAGLDVLELGCGAAQWSIGLARLGARPVGLDLSARQLEYARRAMAVAGLSTSRSSTPAPRRSRSRTRASTSSSATTAR